MREGKKGGMDVRGEVTGDDLLLSENDVGGDD